MKRRAVEISAALLGLLALAATGIILFHIAGLAGVPWLLCAALALLGGYVALMLLYVATNTRRPWGIDPNAPAPVNRERDPFASSTADLMRAKINLPDGNPYGARQSDDTEVVRRISSYVESADAARHAPKKAPSWALDLVSAHAPDELASFDSVDTGLEIPPRDEEDLK